VWKERSLLSTKGKRKIVDVEDVIDGSQDTVITQRSTPTFLDEIAKLRTDTKQQAFEMKEETGEQIEDMRKETTLIAALTQI
jgi:hypothetical protein